MRLIFPLLLALTACAEDPTTLPMPPRPVVQTEGEIDFAAETLDGLQQVSFTDNREYCGLIGLTDDGTLVATPARRGRASSCLPPDTAPGLIPLASYHTHGAYSPEHETEVPSFDDLRSDIADGIDGYVSTPGGRFWFVDARAQEVRQICGAGCLLTDPAFEPDPDFPIAPRYSLEELEEFF